MPAAQENILYLHPDERKLFEKLPVEFRQGWLVQEETLRYRDSAEKRDSRASLFRKKTPALRRLQVRAPAIRSDADVWKLFEEGADSTLNMDDVVNICFTIGPEFMGKLITLLIPAAASQSDIEIPAYFTQLRHAILSSLCTYA